MSDPLAALEQVSDAVASLSAAANSGRSQSLAVAVAQPVVRMIATIYFESVRPELDLVKTRNGLVDELDFVMQSLLRLAAASREKDAYVGQVNELTPLLLEASVDLMKARGNPRLVLSTTERGILTTLTQMLPISAAAYEQVLRDLTQGSRVSWRGTATELREVLREVIDHLAPDRLVMAAAGFQLEDGQQGPTQRQKVRFILRARRSSSAAVNVVEASLITVEEAVANLARTTYRRSSVSTHATSSNTEIKQLKRYIDALLAELLETA
jgi:hypothetical protein